MGTLGVKKRNSAVFGTLSRVSDLGGNCGLGNFRCGFEKRSKGNGTRDNSKLLGDIIFLYRENWGGAWGECLHMKGPKKEKNSA